MSNSIENEIKGLTGVRYYTLKEGYNGDYHNDGKGLTGAQIDNNFYFLRGMDIESASMEGNDIVFKRLNGKKDLRIEDFASYISLSDSTFDEKSGILTLKIGKQKGIELKGFNKVDVTETYYDSIRGVLHLIINGKEVEVSGFYVAPDVDMSYLSGMMTPVKKILDDNILPSYANIGESYITKRNTLGSLFNKDAILAIDNYLAGISSEWHVATLEEWNVMLDSIKICKDDYSGALLKGDKDKWQDTERQEFEEVRYFFNALPTKNEVSGETITYETDFASLSGTVLSIKSFFTDNDKAVETSGETDMYSIRLVRKGTANSDTENIGNDAYKVCLMPSASGETNVWLAENFTIDKETLAKYAVSGHTDIQISIPTESPSYSYTLNVWNGYRWNKKILSEGNIITLLEVKDDKYEQFILYNGDLVAYETGGGGTTGDTTITENILDRKGNILIEKGTKMTEAVKILVNIIDSIDDDISIEHDEEGNAYLRINGISNE